MTKFHMTYNPYRVETSLKVQSGDPVLEESGLLYISKMRLQRWAICDNRCYFDELFEASGDNEVEIIFSGTIEDLKDLTAAADKYQENHSKIRLVVTGDQHCRSNDNTNKIGKLKSLIDKILQSPYSTIMPEEILRHIAQKITNLPQQKSTLFVDFKNWQDGIMFEPQDWQLLCMQFSFEEMRSEKIWRQFQLFAKCMSKVENRNIERERFIFFCKYEDNSKLSIIEMKNTAEKIFLEHGLQDLQFFLLTEEEISNLKKLNYDIPNDTSERYRAAQQAILIYINRYVDQYKAKKIYDLLNRALTEAGFKPVTDLPCHVEEIMHSYDFEQKHVTYSNAKVTYWLKNIINELEHLLDIKAQ